MGLDMRPMGKPKAGYEKRFIQIFNIIQGTEKQKLSFIDKLKGKLELSKDELLQEWFENQIPSYETIKAPMVGIDEDADVWIKQKCQDSDKSKPECDFINDYKGYYVIELAKELDGVPMYISMGEDANVFRGQFIQNCEDLIGEDLVNEAWETKLSNSTLDYGNRLMKITDEIANKRGLQYLKDQRVPPDKDETDVESKIHILYALAKWLIFYGTNGHGYEAYY